MWKGKKKSREILNQLKQEIQMEKLMKKKLQLKKKWKIDTTQNFTRNENW